jgi:hypothetical protein
LGGGGGGGIFLAYCSLSLLSSLLSLNFINLALTCLMAIFLNLSSYSIFAREGDGYLGFSYLTG